LPPSLLIEPLHHVYPLLLAAAILLAAPPLATHIQRDTKLEDMPQIPEKPPGLLRVPLVINFCTERIVPFLSIGATVLALLYVYPFVTDSFFTWSLNIIVVSFSLLFGGFLLQVITLPVLARWVAGERRRYYRQFELAQSKDLKDVGGNDSSSGDAPPG